MLAPVWLSENVKNGSAILASLILSVLEFVILHWYVAGSFTCVVLTE